MFPGQEYLLIFIFFCVVALASLSSAQKSFATYPTTQFKKALLH